MHKKMSKLYEFASTLSPAADADSPNAAVVSIHYSDGYPPSDPSGKSTPESTWFAREARPPENLTQPEKRPNAGNVRLEGENINLSKKRKIRASRQTDVKSLLDLLGPT